MYGKTKTSLRLISRYRPKILQFLLNDINRYLYNLLLRKLVLYCRSWYFFHALVAKRHKIYKVLLGFRRESVIKNVRNVSSMDWFTSSSY